MKIFPTLIEDGGGKSKDQELNLDVALKLNRFNTKSFAILIVNKYYRSSCL